MTKGLNYREQFTANGKQIRRKETNILEHYNKFSNVRPNHRRKAVPAADFVHQKKSVKTEEIK